MQCSCCSKNIDSDSNSVKRGELIFCSNLCRYQYENQNGRIEKNIIAKKVEETIVHEKKKMAKYFPKIINQETALKTIKDVSIAFYFIGGINLLIGIFFSRSLIVDAGICLMLGLALQLLKSRTAAIVMVAYSVGSFGMTIVNKIHNPQNLSNGGTNVMLAIFIMIGAIKAVEATFKYHNKYKTEKRLA